MKPSEHLSPDETAPSPGEYRDSSAQELRLVVGFGSYRNNGANGSAAQASGDGTKGVFHGAVGEAEIQLIDKDDGGGVDGP